MINFTDYLERRIRSGMPFALVPSGEFGSELQDEPLQPAAPCSRMRHVKAFAVGMRFSYVEAAFVLKEGFGEQGIAVCSTADRSRELKEFVLGMIRLNLCRRALFADADGNAVLLSSEGFSSAGKARFGSPRWLSLRLKSLNEECAGIVVDCVEHSRYSELEGFMPTTIQMRSFDRMRQNLAECVSSGTEWKPYIP